MIRLFAFARDLHVQFFTRQYDGLHRVRKFVDVQDGDAFHVRDAVQIIIVRENLAAQIVRQSNELRVGTAHVRIVALAHLEHAQFLQTVEHFQSAPAARAPHRIGRVGNGLQLLQYEARQDKRPLQKAAL